MVFIIWKLRVHKWLYQWEKQKGVDELKKWFQDKIPYVIVWCIWKGRNNRVLRKTQKTSKEIFDEVLTLEWSWSRHDARPHTISIAALMTDWTACLGR